MGERMYFFLAGAVAGQLARWLLQRRRERRVKQIAARNAAAKRELGGVFVTRPATAEEIAAQRESWARSCMKGGPRHAIADISDARRPVRG